MRRGNGFSPPAHTNIKIHVCRGEIQSLSRFGADVGVRISSSITTRRAQRSRSAVKHRMDITPTRSPPLATWPTGQGHNQAQWYTIKHCAHIILKNSLDLTQHNRLMRTACCFYTIIISTWLYFYPCVVLSKHLCNFNLRGCPAIALKDLSKVTWPLTNKFVLGHSRGILVFF